MKFDRQLRLATETSWVVSYCGKTIPRWRTATILKIVISPYLSEKSSDFDDFCTQQQILNWMNVTCACSKWKSCIGQTPSSTEGISCLLFFLVIFMIKQMRLDVSCGKILNSCKCSVDIFMPWPIFPSRTISPMSAIAACYYDATILYCRIMSCVNWSLTVLTGSFFVTCLSGIDYRLSRIDHAHVTHSYYNSLTLTFTRPISMTQPVPV